jgi:dihydropteroate synthase
MNSMNRELTSMRWKLPDNKNLDLNNAPLLMGILNLTPDSFADGNRYFDPGAATRRVERMIAAGAGIIDVGAESSRPGADPVNATQEMERLALLPESTIREAKVPFSIDTYKPEVARFALSRGFTMVNDISGDRTGEMMQLAASAGVPLICMHMRGIPKTMQTEPFAEDIMADIQHFFQTKKQQAEQLGFAHLILDPGIGFGKSYEDNVRILANLNQLSEASYPLLVGASRKRFLGYYLNRDVDDRLSASLAISQWCMMHNVSILRVHDVKETADVIAITRILRGYCYD